MRVALIVDIVRVEEKLIIKALEDRKVPYDIINVSQDPYPSTGL
jgi:glutamate--LysW ligase ArgX